MADSWYSWVVVIGVTTAALLPDVCFRVLQRTLFPADHMIAQEVRVESPLPPHAPHASWPPRPLSQAVRPLRVWRRRDEEELFL